MAYFFCQSLYGVEMLITITRFDPVSPSYPPSWFKKRSQSLMIKFTFTQGTPNLKLVCKLLEINIKQLYSSFT